MHFILKYNGELKYVGLVKYNNNNMLVHKNVCKNIWPLERASWMSRN